MTPALCLLRSKYYLRMCPCYLKYLLVEQIFRIRSACGNGRLLVVNLGWEDEGSRSKGASRGLEKSFVIFVLCCVVSKKWMCSEE